MNAVPAGAAAVLEATVVALGEPTAVAGWRLAGVRVVAAATADEVRAAWAKLSGEAGLVILTPAAAAALPAHAPGELPLTVVTGP